MKKAVGYLIPFMEKEKEELCAGGDMSDMQVCVFVTEKCYRSNRWKPNRDLKHNSGSPKATTVCTQADTDSCYPIK